MKLWGSIAGITFILLMGLVGGLDVGTLTLTQFTIASFAMLGILGFSLNRLSKLEGYEEDEY